MGASDKKLLRAVIRRVHPDLFNALPFERSHNSESLKRLNQFVEGLAATSGPDALKSGTSVSFWTRNATSLELELTEAPLDAGLASLYLAFGLIDEDEAASRRAAAAGGLAGGPGIGLLEWLSNTIADAVATADEHEQRKRLVRELKATVEFKFGLGAVKVGNTYSCSSIDLARQLECLRIFQDFLTPRASAAGAASPPSQGELVGLAFQLYHPHSAPSETYSWADGAGGSPRMAAGAMRPRLGDDGTIHVVADRGTLAAQIATLDLAAAATLGGVHGFWGRRVRDLAPRVAEVLHVRNVWCDNRSAEAQEAFVLWAGRVLSAAEAGARGSGAGDLAEALEGRSFSFTVLVHTDQGSPLIDYMASSSVLQVRSDCAVHMLEEFLTGACADEAEVAALSETGAHNDEAAAFGEVKRTFNARHVIRVCSTEHKAAALDAARRLVAEAHAIRAVVDLQGASIAIDDCYQVWESGFVSIPYNFTVEDLRPKLAALLAAPSGSASSADEEPVGATAGSSAHATGASATARRVAGSAADLDARHGAPAAALSSRPAYAAHVTGAGLHGPDLAPAGARLGSRSATIVRGTAAVRGFAQSAPPAPRAAAAGSRLRRRGPSRLRF